MNCIFKRRGFPIMEILVTITSGSNYPSYAYVEYLGTQHTDVGSFVAKLDDSIVFAVSMGASVYVNNTKVFTSHDMGVGDRYTYAISRSIKSISIAMGGSANSDTYVTTT